MQPLMVAQLEYLWWLPPDGKTQVTIEHVQQVDEIVAGTNGDLWWLPPDGETQVTFEHAQRADETDVYKNGDLWWVRPVGKTHVIGRILGKSSSGVDSGL